MTTRYMRTIVLLALGAVIGCGGSNGGGEATRQITGLCDVCDTDADCEEGLHCEDCTAGCTSEIKRCVGLADGSSLQLNCDDATYPAGCVNIGGNWTLTEDLNGQCSIAGEEIPLEQSGTATVFFNQDACSVSYRVPDLNVDRTGTIVGNRMRLDGPFLAIIDDSVDVAFSENRAALEGTVSGNRMSLMGEGRAGGKVEGQELTCSGVSVGDGRR